jgi:hypothetical protein
VFVSIVTCAIVKHTPHMFILNLFLVYSCHQYPKDTPDVAVKEDPKFIGEGFLINQVSHPHKSRFMEFA